MQQVFRRTAGLTDTPFHYCPGCLHGVIHRILAEVLEEKNLLGKTIGITPVGCSGFCEKYFNVDMLNAAHGRAIAAATGVKRSLPDRIVFSYQGDGDAMAIGLAEIVSAAVRGEKITAIVVNNAIYGMTGGQMAPTSLIGQKTSTSPLGRNAQATGQPLDLAGLISHIPGSAYVAACSVNNPANIAKTKKAFRKALTVQEKNLGFSLVTVLSTCPTNWRLSPVASIEWLQQNMIPQFAMGELKVPEEI
jgi:2-oxoglutarate ferredoxin oxidoreductase subunit beta